MRPECNASWARDGKPDIGLAVFGQFRADRAVVPAETDTQAHRLSV
jgi:hypothetical protein